LKIHREVLGSVALSAPEIRPVPEVLGLMNCQGEVLCVLDLRRILSPGKETAPPAAMERKFIVVIQRGRMPR
jgi:chemotaxis signal transduction protein